MMQLHQDYDEFVKRDTLIVAVGPDNKLSFKKYWEDNNLEFYGLPDPNKKVLGLFNQEFKLMKLGRMPAQMIIDKKGYLKYIHYGESMEDIPDNLSILKAIDEMNNQ